MSDSPGPVVPWYVYRFNFTMLMSFMHRTTGLLLVLVLWIGVLMWTGCVSTPSGGFMTSVIGMAAKWSVAWMLAYHTVSGIRHLIWDKGYGLTTHTLLVSGVCVLLGSVLLMWVFLNCDIQI